MLREIKQVEGIFGELQIRFVLFVGRDLYQKERVENMTSLDVGCGHDPATHHRRGDVGIDLKKGLCTVVATAYYLPFREKCFEKVIMSHILEHLPDSLKALAEVARVLGPRGVLEVEVPNAHSFWLFKDVWLRRRVAGQQKVCHEHVFLFAEVELKNLLAAAGFTCFDVAFVDTFWTIRRLRNKGSLLKCLFYHLLWRLRPAFRNAIQVHARFEGV